MLLFSINIYSGITKAKAPMNPFTNTYPTTAITANGKTKRTKKPIMAKKIYTNTKPIIKANNSSIFFIPQIK